MAIITILLVLTAVSIPALGLKTIKKDSKQENYFKLWD